MIVWLLHTGRQTDMVQLMGVFLHFYLRTRRKDKRLSKMCSSPHCQNAVNRQNCRRLDPVCRLVSQELSEKKGQ